MRIAFAAVFFLLAGFAGDGAEADPYRYCADYGGSNGGRNCYFVTLEQCRAAISGNGGSCNINPFYDGASVDQPARRSPRR